MIPSAPIITGILTCEAHRDHWEPIRGTYMECLPNPFFFKGAPGFPACWCGDVLSLDAPDTYEGLPQKIWALYAYLLEHVEFDYFLRLDDDSVPFVSRFYALLFSIYAERSPGSRPDRICSRSAARFPRMWGMRRQPGTRRSRSAASIGCHGAANECVCASAVSETSRKRS